jgi:hypothetical protein
VKGVIYFDWGSLRQLDDCESWWESRGVTEAVRIRQIDRSCVAYDADLIKYMAIGLYSYKLQVRTDTR